MQALAENQSRRAAVAVSVVVPVYGCVETLRDLHARVTETLSRLVDSFELILVDDRANDGAWPVMRELAEADPRVVACRLSRNFGQQLAITAGLEQCSGDYAVVMDCDLQDPPEAIADLYAQAQKGFDIVFAKRKSQYQSSRRRLYNRAYFKLLGLAARRQFDGELGAFSIVSRRVIDAYLRFNERDRHYLMVLDWLGFETATIEYRRDSRAVGTSSYSFAKLLSLALSGLFFTTTRLLHWVIYTGVALALAGILLAVFFVIHWFFYGAFVGWTSLIVVQLVLSGIVILCIGVTALYVGKIFEAAQNRPLYVMQEIVDGRTAARQPGRRHETAGGVP